MWTLTNYRYCLNTTNEVLQCADTNMSSSTATAHQLLQEFDYSLVEKILGHCKEGKTLQAVLSIMRVLPQLHSTTFLDVPQLLSSLHASRCDFENEFANAVHFTSCEIHRADCPNEVFAERYVEPTWREQEVCVNTHLIGDLKRLVMNYARAYSQRFFIGLLVAVKTELHWYVGKISMIVVVYNIIFLFIDYPRISGAQSDWIPAESDLIKCFYDSQGRLIENAQFIKEKREAAVLCMETGVDVFNSLTATWSKCYQLDDFSGIQFDFSPIGTFTS